MSLPDVVSRADWLAARKELLVREKQATRARDELNAARRRLPMVVIDKDYVFEGPDGKASLAGLFEGRRQLVIYHFMFGPDWDAGCPSCSGFADQVGHLEHLNATETTFAAVSRAPLAKITPFRQRMGWTFPWYSAYGSDFNYDFHVTLDESVAPVEYNYRTRAEHEQAGSAPTTWTASSRSSCPASAASCATATRSSTPTRPTGVAWTIWASASTCWT